jgi:hypothetical protein
MNKRLKALEAKSAQEGGRRAGKGQDRERGSWRVRERASGLLRRPGYVLCRQSEGISRPSSTSMPRSPAPSSTIARHRSRRPICSTTG